MKQWVLIIHATILLLYIASVNEYSTNTDVSVLAKTERDFNQVHHLDTVVNLILIRKSITIKNYFQFMDSVVKKYDSLTSYELSEHLIVRANPWIIDTLANTDYYRMIVKDSFVYDQKDLTVLKEGQKIIIPDALKADTLQNSFKNTRLDINIPEFKLRIIEDSTIIYTFPIRVGQNKKKYLKMSDKIEDLRTKTGEGLIVNHVRNPRYVNPVNNHEYAVTKRDDNKVTKLPQIPFIEAEINGLRNGQLIHPTTNPVTLGKPYSNGCIGTKEADAWVIYYYAPINTNITIRYNLEVANDNDKKITLKDIYGYYKTKN